jgi:predicted TIM-barrel fold metal-dependent hydrolase
MTVIDCDAHVEESVQTWSYLDPAFYPYRPIPVVFPEDTCWGSHNAAWVIDYKLRYSASSPTNMKRGSEKGAPIGSQELTDVELRLACMDETGIDKQVVFPSIWQGCLAEQVELEAALARSHNQFMATQCGASGGRLSYVAVVPFRRPDLAVAEIRRVKQAGGAAAVYARGIEWDLPLSHPMLWPIYEEAARQDLPVAVHVGNGASPAVLRMLEGVPRPYLDDFPQTHPLAAGLNSGPFVLYAFQQLLSSSLLEDFPDLRLAFLETGTDWTVRLVKGLVAKKGPKVGQWLGERVFVSCSLSDDLPYVISKLGDDFLITASDYPHGDAFREDHLSDGLTRRGDLSERTVEKILTDNPQRLFHHF